jgi:hypothetical protein
MIAARACSICGEVFVPRRRSTAFLCSARCKQAAYRRRLRRARVTGSGLGGLSFEQRQWLKREVDRLSRARLVDEARRQAALDAQLAEEALA